MKTVRKILLIVCGILLLAAVAVSVLKYISVQKENQALEEKSYQ